MGRLTQFLVKRLTISEGFRPRLATLSSDLRQSPFAKTGAEGTRSRLAHTNSHPALSSITALRGSKISRKGEATVFPRLSFHAASSRSSAAGSASRPQISSASFSAIMIVGLRTLLYGRFASKAAQPNRRSGTKHTEQFHALQHLDKRSNPG